MILNISKKDKKELKDDLRDYYDVVNELVTGGDD